MTDNTSTGNMYRSHLDAFYLGLMNGFQYWSTLRAGLDPFTFFLIFKFKFKFTDLKKN